MKKKTMKKELVPYVLLLLAAFFILFTTDIFGGKVHELTYNEFETNLKNNKITELTIVPRRDGMIYDVSGKLEGYKDKESFYSTLPLTDTTIDRILEAKDTKDFKVVAKSDPASGFLVQFLFNVFPLILLMGFAIFYLNRQMGSSNKSMDFGKSRAKLSEDNGHTTFKNVAGLIEEKEEVAELIDFLKNPKKFQKMGARIPKGVLLVGPPGTGKTLLAKAVAGEANVPFYFISGSDFVELFVGIGASRVRDMFRQAKQNAPC